MNSKGQLYHYWRFYLFVVLIIGIVIVPGSIGSGGEGSESSNVIRTASTDTTCVPIEETEEICFEDYCVDYDEVFNETSGEEETICVDMRDTYCRTNTIYRDSCTKTLYSGTMNYFDGNEFVPIDTTILSSDSLWDYEVTKGVYSVFFKEDPTQGQVVKYVKDDVEVTFQPMTLNYRNDLDMIQQIEMINPVTGTSYENEFIYDDAYGNGIDLKYTYYNEILKEGLILDDFSVLSSPEQYIIDGGNPTLDLDFVLETNSNHIVIDGFDWDKKTLTSTSNDVYIKDDSGNILYKLPKPYAYDVNSSSLLTYEFKKSGNSLYIILKTNYSWLENAVYPVVIDPTIKLVGMTDNIADTWNSDSNPDTNYGDDDTLTIWGTRTIWATWNLTSLPDSVVTDAILRFDFVSSHEGEGYYGIYNTTIDTFNESNMTYNNQPLSSVDTLLDTPYVNVTEEGPDDVFFNVTNATFSGKDAITFFINISSGDPGGEEFHSRHDYEGGLSGGETIENVKPYLNITYSIDNITISDCTVLDADGGHYYLDSDIINSGTSNCMDITANNVILDCQGHTIDGDDDADIGINIDWISETDVNVTVKNCILSDWDTDSIFIEKAHNVTVDNVTIIGTWDGGVEFKSADDGIINNSNITGGGARWTDEGVKMFSADRWRIENTIIHSSWENLDIDNSKYGTAVNSNFTDAYGWDVVTNGNTDSECSTVFTNILTTDDKPMLYINNSDTTIEHVDNVSLIVICNADDVVLNNITMHEGGDGRRGNGIWIDSSERVNITNSSISGKEIAVSIGSGSSNAYLENNYFNYSDDSGVEVKVDNGKIYNNTFYNSDYIELELVQKDNWDIYDNIFWDDDTTTLLDLFGNSHSCNVYNNLFNFTGIYGDHIDSDTVNFLNTTKQTGTRIYSNGTQIGGNYYTTNVGDGYSDTCTDADYDGFCDVQYNSTGDGFDYLPLSDEYLETPPDTCSCPSSENWEVDCSDDCTITEDCNIASYELNFYNTGSFTIEADIYVDKIGTKPKGCQVINHPNDGNRLIIVGG